MPTDERTYGFSKDDASELINMIGSSDSPYGKHTPRGSSIRLVRFSLLADFVTGTASATIKNMTGTTIETANVLDPEGIFSELVASDTGLAIKQGGQYYAIQAPCSSGEE
jgi:hypothetical protein